ncbi:MAG: hypothetical protein WC661_14080 [Opitutaceae bacterium]|jgi:hypothetical protein
MNLSPNKAGAKISQVITAWETLRPAKTFAGLTLDQFKTAVQPSIDTRANIESLKDQLAAAQTLRQDADEASIGTILLVVNAVKGDPAEGEDGELYEAMGYVRKSERRSGLSRGKKTATVTA